MRQRPQPSTSGAAYPAQLDNPPNGAEVYAKGSQRLKGYVFSPRPGSGVSVAYDAKRQFLGEGSQGTCFNLLDTPRAVRAASEVFVETPKRKRG